jgi:hypothetical protein
MNDESDDNDPDPTPDVAARPERAGSYEAYGGADWRLIGGGWVEFDLGTLSYHRLELLERGRDPRRHAAYLVEADLHDRDPDKLTLRLAAVSIIESVPADAHLGEDAQSALAECHAVLLAPYLERIRARFDPRWPPSLDIQPGWYQLVLDLTDMIEIASPGTTYAQIKQKVGGLRVYIEKVSEPARKDLVRALIADAEAKANVSCEKCGRPAERRTDFSNVETLCDFHARRRW